MEEFIRVLTEQMRCVKARGSVAQELADHIADQAQAYERSGVDRDQAIARAVREMGDPVEIGVAMDRIHRPQADWKMLVLTFVLGIAGVLCMVPVYGSARIIPGQILMMLAGFVVTIAVYFVDYSVLGRIGAAAYPVLTVFLWIGKTWLFPVVNGRVQQMTILAYLYVPIFAGILYQLRRKGFRAVLAGIGVIGATVFFVGQFAAVAGTTVNLFLIMTFMLAAAAAKGMFGERRKLWTAVAAAVGIFPLLVGIGYVCLSDGFRAHRLRAFFFRDQYQDAEGFYYVMICDILNGSRLFGRGSSMYIGEDTVLMFSEGGLMPTGIIYFYGTAAGILLAGMLAVFVLRALRIVRGQKNQLGFLVSMACFLVLLVNCAEGILVGVGLFPVTTTVMPFLMRGGSATLVYAVLIGLLLSVHRYERVYTREPYAPQPHVRISVKTERR